MKADRQVDKIFHDVLEQEQNQRASFLARVCGSDLALRKEVEALIISHEGSGRVLNSPSLAPIVGSLVGKTLGPYEVKSLLGSGGMGEVYRGRDSKLKRDVAIKVLPDAFSRDSERLTRFHREAEILASLNHPHIAAIYDVADLGSARFLVLELVEGETLADRIRRGPVPRGEALLIGKQIAEALEAAHDKGIIHRDLKPANIKITLDGNVKVLDFGLAKVLHAESEDPSQTPTELTETGLGIVMGTPAYMSPEQAKGRPVDRRTDVFAFGCVLYAMLTGRAAFEGEDTAEILSRVLQREPDWTLLPADTPSAVRNLLRLCLEKNLKDRRTSATDVRLDIDQAQKESGEATPTAVPAKNSTLAWIFSAAAAVGLAALAIPAVIHLRETPPAAPPEMRVDIMTPDSSVPLHFALSPDGSSLVFVANDNGTPSLWVRPLNTGVPQPLAGTDGAVNPFWSPDSRSIGFFASNKLYRIDIAGGTPQMLASAALSTGGAWNADGTILFAPLNGPVLRVASSGGEPVAVTRLLPGQIGHRSPTFLPDGRQFLFTAGGPENSGIYLASLDGGEPKRLMARGSPVEYLEPGWLVFLRQGSLMAQRLDVAHATLTDQPVRVADGVLSFSAAGGRLAYRAGRSERRQLTWFTRTGKNVGVAGEPDTNDLLAPELSPNERHIAVDRTVQNNRDVWLMDLERGGLTRLTTHATLDAIPLWSPKDGTQIVFNTTRNGSYDIWMKPASGTGTEELLLGTPNINEWPLDWSKDGRFLLYNQNGGPKTGTDVWALPITGNDRKPIGVSNTLSEERQGQFSPDSRWVAYETNESGSSFEIVVQPFPEPTGKWQVSIDGGFQPRWRADGKEIYFIAPDKKLMAVKVKITGSDFEAGKPEALFETRIAGGTFRPQYAVSKDGRFLINQVIEKSSTGPITLILNWNPEQKK